MATDPFEALGYVSVISSLLTLILYEMRIDELLVKRWYSRDWGKMALNTHRAFLSWDILLNTWDTVVSDPPQFRGGAGGYDWLVKRYTKSVVSSYVIRKRLWSIRGSMYLFLAVPFMVWTGLDYLNSFFIQLPSAATLLLVFALCIGFWIIQFLFNRTRHKPLREQIRHLVVFRYAQQLVAYDALACELAASDQRASLRKAMQTEFDFLDRIIIREDWTTFTERWVPIRWNTELKARRDFIPLIIPQLYEIWEKHRVYIEEGKRNTNEILASARRFAWYLNICRELHKAAGRSLGRHTRDILNFVSEVYDDELPHIDSKESDRRIPFQSRLLLPLTKPVYILARAPTKLLNEGPRKNEGYTKSFAVFLLNWLQSQYALRLGKDGQFDVKTESEIPEANERSLINALLQILDQCATTEKFTGIWTNLQTDHEMILLENLWDRMNRITGKENLQLLCYFLREASTEARLRLLGLKPWQDALSSSEVQSTLSELLRTGSISSHELKEKIGGLIQNP